MAKIVKGSRANPNSGVKGKTLVKPLPPVSMAKGSNMLGGTKRSGGRI